MLTEQALTPQLSVLDPVSKSVMIILQTAILRDGVEIARESNSMTFQQGQLAEVKAFLGVETGPEIDYITAIWG